MSLLKSGLIHSCRW